MNSAYIYLLILVGVTAFAFARGDSEARSVAIICVVATALTALTFVSDLTPYAELEGGVALIDLGVLAAFITIALKSPRFWPLWISGLQLTTTMGHLLRIIEPDMMSLAYAAALRSWSYPILLILAVATWRGHRRRLRGAA